MAVREGGGAIHVDDGHRLVGDGLLEVSDADVREFGGECGGGDEGQDECDEFLHDWMIWLMG